MNKPEQHTNTAEASGWHVYIIQRGDGALYTGITTDPQRRRRQHAEGRGAKYLRGQGELRLVYLESGHDHTSAARRELAIKRLRRAAKLALIAAAAAGPD